MAAILWMTDRWSSTNSAVIFSILPFCILICFCHCNHHSFPSKKCQSCGNHHKLTQSVFYNTSPPFDFAAFSAASFTGGFAAASFCLSFRSFNTDPFSSDFHQSPFSFPAVLPQTSLQVQRHDPWNRNGRHYQKVFPPDLPLWHSLPAPYP